VQLIPREHQSPVHSLPSTAPPRHRLPAIPQPRQYIPNRGMLDELPRSQTLKLHEALMAPEHGAASMGGAGSWSLHRLRSARLLASVDRDESQTKVRHSLQTTFGRASLVYDPHGWSPLPSVQSYHINLELCYCQHARLTCIRCPGLRQDPRWIWQTPSR
jgi:hypothetical protein